MKDDGSQHAFEADKPGTVARTRAEALVEGVRQLGGVFVDAVRATGTAMVLTDPRLPGNPIIFANQSFLDLSGYSMDEVLGQQPHFLNGPDTDPEDTLRFESSLENAHDEVVETVQYRKDRSSFIAAVLISSFKDDDGQTVHRFLTWVDISRRVNAETTLAALRHTESALRATEQRLAEDLTDTRLVQAAGAVMIDNSREDDAEHAILSAAMKLMQSDASSIQMLDETTGDLLLLGNVGFHPESVAFWQRVNDESGGSCGQAIKQRQRIIVEDVEALEVLRDSEDLEAYRRSGLVSVQSTPLVTRSGKLIGMMSTHWRRTHRPDQRKLGHFDVLARQAADLIERRSAENALRKSEALFRQFAEASSDVLWIRSAETMQFDYVSPVFEEIYGAALDDLLGDDDLKRWAEFIHPEDRDQSLANLERVRSGARITHEFRIRHGRSGVTRWIRDTSFPLMDERGRVQRVAGIGQDISEQKRAEAALRENEEQLRLIVGNARDYAIFMMDERGIVTDWREGAEAIFGFSREEIVGRSSDILYTDEDIAIGQPFAERDLARQTGKAPDVRWHARRDRSRVFIEGVNTALRDANGKLTGFLKIGRDATERHSAEQRQKLLLAELQHRVRNILAMVRSVVRQSSGGYTTAEEFVGHLTGRLDAMARTQVLLTRAPGAQVGLEELVWDELESQLADPERAKVKGPKVHLSPKAAEVLTLALHELTTNSLKYGALSDPSGSLAVTWGQAPLDGDTWLQLTWEEVCPHIAPKPIKSGFGTDLIEQRVPYELRGEAALHVTAGGVRAEIAFPLTEGSSVLETGPVPEGLR